MDEADRRARNEVARRRAASAADERGRAQADRDRKREIEREIRDLTAELLSLLRERDLPGLVPLTLRSYRVPLLGDLFGFREVVRGGWPMGRYGAQSLALLGNGDAAWSGRTAKLSEFDHCTNLYLRNLQTFREWVLTGDYSAPFDPSRIDPKA
jgi:hypothetical protein